MAENTNIDTEKTTQEQPKPETPSVDDLARQIKDLQAKLEKQKKALDNAASDAADWKKKYNSTLTEAQQKENARAEEEKRLRMENEVLKRDKVIGAYSNRALSLGYDADLAAATAEAMANGDMSAVFDGIGQLIEAVKTKTVTENYAKQASLSTGTPPSTNTVSNDEENKYRKWMGLPPLKK